MRCFIHAILKWFNPCRQDFSSDLGRLWLRLLFGFMMLAGHGWGKLQKLLAGGEIKFSDFMGLPPVVNLTLATAAEFGAALLVMLGLATRLSSIPLVFTMAVAAFYAHAADPFFDGARTKEKALLYLVGFLAIFLLGPGRFSLDHLIKRRLSQPCGHCPSSAGEAPKA